MLRCQQWFRICSGHEPQPVEFAERARYAEQAAEHYAGYHGSGQQHALHGCGWHRSDPKLIVVKPGINWRSLVGGNLDEPGNGDSERRPIHAYAGYRNPQCRNRNSESEYGHSRHCRPKSGHAIDSGHRHDHSQFAKFAEQWNVVNARINNESWEHRQAAEHPSSSVFDLKAFRAFEPNSPTALTSDGCLQDQLAWEPCLSPLSRATSNSPAQLRLFPDSIGMRSNRSVKQWGEYA